MSVYFRHSKNLGGGNRIVFSKRVGGSGKGNGGGGTAGIVTLVIVIALGVAVFSGGKGKQNIEPEEPATVQTAERSEPTKTEETEHTQVAEPSRSMPESIQETANADDRIVLDETVSQEESAECTVWIASSGDGTRYHNENCRTLKGGKREVTITEAEKFGYTPCRICFK